MKCFQVPYTCTYINTEQSEVFPILTQQLIQPDTAPPPTFRPRLHQTFGAKIFCSMCLTTNLSLGVTTCFFSLHTLSGRANLWKRVDWVTATFISLSSTPAIIYFYPIKHFNTFPPKTISSLIEKLEKWHNHKMKWFHIFKTSPINIYLCFYIGVAGGRE